MKPPLERGAFLVTTALPSRQSIPWKPLGLGAIGVGVVGWLLSRRGAPAPAPVLTSRPEFGPESLSFEAALPGILAAVAKNEGGGYGALNRNTDGQGLSYGMFQWSQRSGSLGTLLMAMAQASLPDFTRIFGVPWEDLLEQVAKGSLDPVGGVLLWEEPWVSRFKAAAQVPAFQQVQRNLAATGPYMQAALAVAQRLGVTTQRGLALCLDRAVQQGPGGFRGALAAIPGPLTPLSLARLTAAGYRTYIPDTTRVWKLHNIESYLDDQGSQQFRPTTAYHAYRKSIDLYESIIRRSSAILTSPDLSDAPVDLP